MPQFNLTPRGVWILLMVTSALALMAPPGWTDPLKHVAQLLVPAQDLARSAAIGAAEAASTVTGTEAAIRQHLSAVISAERAANEQLRAQIASLRGVRQHYLSDHVPLLDARVVAMDIAAWRDAALVARGSTRGVSRSDWVASRCWINRGQTDDMEPGQPVLSEESLLGRVEQVSPFMSRVQLLTDPDCPRMEVRIASAEHHGQLVDYACSLRGHGGRRMIIENVAAGYVALDAEPTDVPRIRQGDYVVSAPGVLGIPSPMAVGRIAELTDDPRRRLVYDLIVEPIVDIDALREVFIIPLVPIKSVPIP
jgi:cell shape-determining protein MreC